MDRRELGYLLESINRIGDFLLDINRAINRIADAFDYNLEGEPHTTEERIKWMTDAGIPKEDL